MAQGNGFFLVRFLAGFRLRLMSSVSTKNLRLSVTDFWRETVKTSGSARSVSGSKTLITRQGGGGGSKKYRNW